MAIVDHVIWTPQGRDIIYAYRFPETNLSTYTQLTVYPNQEAILFSKGGELIEKFGPGKYTLNTENLPVLRRLFGIPFGGKNPFTAEVWFFNKQEPYNIDWAIDRMDMHDPDYNTNLPLIAQGRYSMNVADSERFYRKIVVPRHIFYHQDLTDHFFGEFATKTKSTILQFMHQQGIGLKKISAHLDLISEHLKNAMAPFCENLGMRLNKFYVTSVEIDDSTEVGRRVLDAISRQSAQSIAGYTWQQEKAFDVANNAIDGFSDSNSGILGAVIATNMMGGMGGMGSGMMQPQFSQPTFSPAGQQQAPQSPSVQPATHDVYCSNCSKKYPANTRFCPFCGDEYNPCPKCRTDNDKNAKRCVSCGTALQYDMNLCPNCQSPLAPGASFCGNCGKPQETGKCRRCGTALSPSIRFCPNCGQKNQNN